MPTSTTTTDERSVIAAARRDELALALWLLVNAAAVAIVAYALFLLASSL